MNKNKTARLSPCKQYRYLLTRGTPRGRVYCFIGLNPSTADATIDDATVRKWRGFVERLGGSGFAVVNVFGYRATDPKELANARDPVGPDNDEHIRTAIGAADVVVPCWGNESKAPPALRTRFDEVRALIARAVDDEPVLCFGVTKSGAPKHPLMLGYDTKLIPYEVRA